ncbi:hypothetical protein [Streptosporangium sp. NPDC000396]|uniref:hypothetical protein n=1 Tax=Streptosporangium sp. NPDC000396 TaxID=3366185 RepID=UPI003673E445
MGLAQSSRCARLTLGLRPTSGNLKSGTPPDGRPFKVLINKDDDVARLSPLKERHINFLGRYLFNIKAGCPGHGLRPFRDPDAVEDDEG